MRKTFLLLLLSLLISNVLIAQKKNFTRKSPATPVMINTIQGRNLPVPKMQPLSAGEKVNAINSRPKVTMRNKNLSKNDKFTKVTRRVPISVKSKDNQRGKATFKDLDIYYPRNKNQVNNTSFQRKKLTYASITLSSQGDVDNFNTTYPNCDEVGTLLIDGGSINGLATLNNITGIGAIIVKNTSLTSLSDLQSLTTIYDSLVIQNNGALTEIGLNNISQLGGLYIRSCAALQTVDGLGVSSVNNDIRIENSGVTSLAGLSNITDIGGDLTIQNTPIESLAEMNNLQNLHYLDLQDNSQLSAIGLSNIISMWGFIIQSMPNLQSIGSLTQNLDGNIGTLWLGDMQSLNDISGLSNINSVANIIIYGCGNLYSLDGLEGIIEAPYGIFIYNNSVGDISALSNISTVEYDKLEIGYNYNLASLDGLQNIEKADALWIYNNSELTNLNDLNTNLEIYNVNGDDLQIYNNSQLTVCSVPAICNYLNSTNAVDPQIYNNAGSCGDLASVLASCGGGAGCGTLEDVTWNGSNSDDWSDPSNWTPNKVPDQCSRVIIPSTAGDYPNAGDDISVGGLKMSSASLYLNGYNLTIGDSVSIYDSEISGGGYITMAGSANPTVSFSTFDVYGVDILNYKGACYFYNNTVYASNISISDRPSRAAMSLTFGNYIGGTLTFTNNSDYGENYLSNGNNVTDDIDEDLIINNNSNAIMSIGLGDGEPLSVGRNVELNSPDADVFYVDKITFGQSLNGSFTVSTPGINPFEIKNLFFRKYYEAGMNLQQPVKVSGKLVMGSDLGYIKTQNDKMLIIGDTCALVDEDPINGSLVEGPMKKIGNSAFTFPLGKIPTFDMRTKKPGEKLGENKKGVIVVYYKAPLGISAPSEMDASFIAEYKADNPVYEGYDTASKVQGVGSIQTKEYWNLIRESGASNVSVTLNFNDGNIDDDFTPSNLQVIGWDGSKWLNWGNGGTTGTVQRGSVVSATPLTSYGPMALAVQNVRKPIITIAPYDSLVCLSSTLMVHFTLDTNAVEGNTLRVQLSDKDGSFASGTIILNSKTTNQSDSILVTIPSYLIPGSQYRIRIISTQQGLISENAPLLIPQAPPQATFTIEGESEICMGTGIIKYYPSDKEEGVTYNWTVTKGSLTVVNDTAFVTFTSSGTATIKATPSNNCANGTAVSRNITVKPGAPVATPELTNVGRWLNASAPPAGQTVTTYNWYKNGTLISGANTSTYYASEAGTYTVEYANNCGASPLSNTVTFDNASIPQTITFDNLPNKVYGDEPFNLPATASSGLPVTYQIVSGPGNVTSGVYTITYTGTVVIKAYQLGDNQYDTAAPVIKSFVISKSPQTISFDSIPDYDFKGSASAFYLSATASSRKAVSFSSPSTNVSLVNGRVTVNGLGNVTITASQAGDTNYLAASPVTRTFCVRVMKLNPITGAQYVCPGNSSVYRTSKIAGLTYSWRLSDGTTYPSNADTVKITWPTTGVYTLIVSATGPCGPSTPNDSIKITVMDATIAPGPISNMLPSNGSIDQRLPLVLSWIPGSNTLSYDVFVWETGTGKPANPIAANITDINYTVPKNKLTYDKTYNWQVISKNGCLQASGPVQTFTLRKLPDLAVSEVQVPATANSGQNITINWKVKNIGGGVTTTNESWNDAVFLSFDTIPQFTSVVTGGTPWSIFDFPVKPMLIGTKKNVASLGLGEEYTNSINVTLPRDVSQPLYVYVIANYNGGATAPLDANRANDTARAADPIVVTLTPTPDLRVDTVLTPATTFSGSKINVTYKVTNYGVLTPSGNTWKDKIYISRSPLFNKEQAIPLQAPKANETYYRSNDIVVGNNQQLEQDESITKSVEVIIPNFISGTWFIHVIANDGNVMYEGALSNNNDNNHVIQVILTPTPQFSINSINLPVTQLSTTQPVGINWNVNNTGFFDNIEKNKGFYGKIIGICHFPGIKNGKMASSGNINSGARGGYVEVKEPPVYNLELDSLSWGSSYWVDKIYLSTDPSGLNIGNALYLGQAIKGIKDLGWQMPDNLYQSQTHCGDNAHGPVPHGTTNNVLSPGSNHPNSFGFAVPGDLPEGDYYFYIQTNSTKTVFTYPDVPVIARSEKVTVSWPDLTVPSVTVPTAITGGVPFTFEYSVVNNGPGSVYDASRVDKIYVSSSSVFDGSATLIKSVNVKESVVPGSPAQQSISLSLPHGASGTQYFYVEVNAGKVFKEKSFSNNISSGASSNVTSFPPADLSVTNVEVPGTIASPGFQNSKLFYTVKNIGSNEAKGETIDSIYISCSPVFNPALAVFLTSNKKTRTLAAGESITDSVNIYLNKQAYLLRSCFAKADISSAYFFVKTNGNQGVYEAGNIANNMSFSEEKSIENRNADLVVDTVTGDDIATVGRPYHMEWVVTNIVSNSVTITSDRYDSIYFSKDPVFNENAIGVWKKRNVSSLNPSTPLPNSEVFTLPKIDAGDYYVFVFTNATNNVSFELNRGNNTNMIRDQFGVASKVHVVQPTLSDLVVAITAAPGSVAVGQPVEFTYRVTNNGAGVTYPDKWSDEVWLMRGTSSKPNAVNGDILLTTTTHSGNLEAGNYYDVTGSVSIPINTPEGNYLLTSFTDMKNAVIENIDSNNIARKPITIYVPAPSDLIVESVSVPDTVYLGYKIDSVKWVVQNNSVNNAKGISTDGIYLSKGNVFDSSAVLVGIKNKNIDLNPLSKDTLAMAPLINNVPEGNYNVIVRTDLLNNIFESDKANNENHTLKPVYVSVKELHLGITQADILQDGRYYKLVIPDSLEGSTILVTLKSEDSLSVLNEMYVGKGHVPSVTTFDYKFHTPNYGNQQILITDVIGSVYYISVRCVSANPPPQNITLTAVKLPFAILNVQSNKGGNGGNVTVKLTGSLFADSMKARLVNGGTVIIASQVYFYNSTLAYATFPLQGKPIGVYDVVLEKTDSSETILQNGFSIVSPDNGGLYSGGGVNTGPSGPGTQPGCDPGSPAGMNSQLVTEMILPENVFAGWPFIVQINYTNPTNMDIPVQTRILYNDKGLPMSFTRENVANGNTSSLYLELSEVDGPPGVFRAGSSGTITIYTVAPVNTPAHTYVKFNLK